MRNILKLTIIASLIAAPAIAEENKSIKQLIEEDAARDPYAESGTAGITFTDKTVTKKVTETDPTFKIDLDEAGDSYRYQRENADKWKSF